MNDSKDNLEREKTIILKDFIPCSSFENLFSIIKTLAQFNHSQKVVLIVGQTLIELNHEAKIRQFICVQLYINRLHLSWRDC